MWVVKIPDVIAWSCTDIKGDEESPVQRASKRPKVVLRLGKHDKSAELHATPAGKKGKMGRAADLASPGGSKKRGEASSLHKLQINMLAGLSWETVAF